MLTLTKRVFRNLVLHISFPLNPYHSIVMIDRPDRDP